VQALGVEAFARREQESIVLFRADARARVGSACGVKDAHEVPAMLAPVFHLAPRTMANVLGETQLLVNALPRTFALVRAGRLEVSRARAVANEAVPVGPGLRRRYEAQLYGGDAAAGEPKRLAAVTGLSYGALRARATRAAVRVDPDAAKDRAALGLGERDVRIRPGADPGMSTGWAAQPADVSLQAWSAIDALAADYVAGQPALSIAQARADAMMSLILGQATITTILDLLVSTPTTDTTDTTDTSTDPARDTSTDPARDTVDGPSTDPATDQSSDPASDPATDTAGSTSAADPPARLPEPDPLRETARATIRAAVPPSAPSPRWSAPSASATRGSGSCSTSTSPPCSPTPTPGCGYTPSTRPAILTRHDPRTYRPAAALARAVRARTCGKPAAPPPQCAASSTTSPPSPPAPPPWRTSPASAPPTTASNTTPAGD